MSAADSHAIPGAVQVAVHRGVGVGQRVADARLGREMDHMWKPLGRKQRRGGRTIGEVELDEAEVRLSLEPLQARGELIGL